MRGAAAGGRDKKHRWATSRGAYAAARRSTRPLVMQWARLAPPVPICPFLEKVLPAFQAAPPICRTCCVRLRLSYQSASRLCEGLQNMHLHFMSASKKCITIYEGLNKCNSNLRAPRNLLRLYVGASSPPAAACLTIRRCPQFHHGGTVSLRRSAVFVSGVLKKRTEPEALGNFMTGLHRASDVPQFFVGGVHKA